MPIENIEDFGEWMIKASPENIVLISHRVVLRTLPALMTDKQAISKIKNWKADIAFPIFCATYMNSMALKYKSFDRMSLLQGDMLKAVKASSHFRIGCVGDFTISAAGIYIAFLMDIKREFERKLNKEPEDDGNEFSNNIIEAVDRLSRLLSIQNEMWTAIDFDIKRLKLDQIIDSPLWPKGMPVEAAGHWESMKKAILTRGEHWHVWTNWYESQLFGSSWASQVGRPSVQDLDIARSEILQNIGRSGVKQINERIIELEVQRWGRNATPLQISKEAQQTPAPYRFEVDTRIEAVPLSSASFDPSISEVIAGELSKKAKTTIDYLVGNHRDDDVSQALHELLNTLSSKPLSEGLLLMRYRSIEAIAASYTQSSSEHDKRIVTLLLDLLSSLDDLKNCFPNIQKIESQRVALRFQNDAIHSYRRDAEQLIDNVKLSSLIDISAVNALRDGLSYIDKLSAKIDSIAGEPNLMAALIEKRAALAGTHSLDVRNFAAAVVELHDKNAKAKDHPKGLLSKVGRAAEKGLLKAIETSAEKTTATTINIAIASLVGVVVGPLAGMAAFVTGMMPVSKKLSEINTNESRDLLDV